MHTLNKKILSDFILAVSLIAVALIAYFISRAMMGEGEFAVVTIGGETVATYSLATDGEYPILDGKNIRVIEDGAAYMKDADCPDKTCVRAGKISRSGERITCLPNGVIVIIEGEDEEIFESK